MIAVGDGFEITSGSFKKAPGRWPGSYRESYSSNEPSWTLRCRLRSFLTCSRLVVPDGASLLYAPSTSLAESVECGARQAYDIQQP